jgi:hypothetical protein
VFVVASLVQINNKGVKMESELLQIMNENYNQLLAKGIVRKYNKYGLVYLVAKNKLKINHYVEIL